MADVGNLLVRVGLESSGFQQGVSRIHQEMRRVESEFKAANAEVNKHKDALGKLKLKSEELTQKIDLQQQKVTVLEEAHRKAVEAKGAHSNAAVNLETQLNLARAALSGMQQDLEAVNRDLATQSNGFFKFGQQLESIGKPMAAFGDKMKDVGKTMMKYVSGPLIGIGAVAVKIGSDFEASMSKVQAISGATGEELAALADKAKEMGASTKFSASESAEALGFMAMAGWETSQMLDGLEGVMLLAAASGENLASVSDIVTDAMTAFKMEAKEAGNFADLLANTASSANVTVASMGETFKYVAPLFGAMGYSAEDAALAIGLMGNAGRHTCPAARKLAA